MLLYLNYFLTIFTLVAPLVYLLLIILRFKKYLTESKIILAWFFIATVVLFNKLLFFNQTLAAQDFNNIQYPFFEFLRQSLKEYFLIPFWNPNFGGGFDVFSNPLAFYFSTLSWLFYFSENTYQTLSIYLAFQVFLAGTFSFLMLREFGLKKYSAFFGSVLYTFNGFVIMRLAPGIGTEYLFSYKWLPLVLLFSYSYFINNKKNDWIFLALSLAFAFEGNTNIAISIWLLWGVFSLFILGRSFISRIYDLFKIVIFSLSIYAIKLIPGIDLMLNSPGRISEVVSGWRVSRVSVDRIFSYFIPIKDNYLAGPFTPGIIGFTFFVLGLILFLFWFIRRSKKISSIQTFSLLSLVLGLFLTSAGTLSDLFYSLPLLNRLTINPSFYIFLILPIAIFSASFFEYLLEVFNKYDKYLSVAIVLFSTMVFLEILTGPSTFGAKTYSFNFEKMNLNEVEKYPLHNYLNKNINGNFVFLEESRIFLLPNSVQFYGLKNLNRSSYFYGTSYFNEIPLEIRLENYKIQADYIVALKDINDNDLELTGKVNLKNYTKNYNNFAIKDMRDELMSYIGSYGWDENLRIYRVLDSVSQKALINTSNHPFSFSILLNEKNVLSSEAKTSISYSKHWKLTNQNGEVVSFDRDPNGFLVLKNVKPYESIYFNFINLYIYLGFFISGISFIYFIYKFRESQL